MRHVVIGCGGIGGWVIRGLAPTLTPEDTLVLIDGDRYEPRNLVRQGQTSGGKAEAYQRVARAYSAPVQAVAAFVSMDGAEGTYPIKHAVQEGDTVWVCPDNHATRHAAIEQASQLSDITLLIGGNDGTDGNVILYRRVADLDMTPHPYIRHPELANPAPFTPPTVQEHQLSCAVMADQGDTQTILANMQAAVCMLALHATLRAERTDNLPHTVYFDTLPLGIRAVS